MNRLTLGYSPCPNDTFIFYAMIHGKIDTGNSRFSEVLLDVETLNQKALNSELDITKISYHAFGHLRDHYCLLRSGGALGRGCGPLLIARGKDPIQQVAAGSIAIPGELTTANLLLRLYFSSLGMEPASPVPMPFHEIIDAVHSRKVNAGVIIHESRFTYEDKGLTSLIDLGAWWEKETGLPIPLGAIVARRSLGRNTLLEIERSIGLSVNYAFEHPNEPAAYIREHSQELADDVVRKHTDLYVNDFSRDLGPEGERAVRALLSRAESSGIIPPSSADIFIETPP